MEIENSTESASTENTQTNPPVQVDASAVVSTPEPERLPDLKYPEGMVLDQGVRDAFEDLRHGRIDHQAFLDGFFRSAAAASERSSKAAKDAQDAQAKAWHEQISSDPVFGGEHLAETGAAADRALRHLSPGGELAAALKGAGLQKHPAVLKAFATIGKGLSEDSVGGTVSSASAPPDEYAFMKYMYGK